MEETQKVNDGVFVPFTPDQVASLNAYQESELVHPYTCGSPDCPALNWGDESLPMAADTGGLHCIEPGCRYVQSWVHDWAADWSWCKREDQARRTQRRGARRTVRQLRRVMRKLAGKP
jgi:hypothetical protein